jgi:hypothetical protein
MTRPGVQGACQECGTLTLRIGQAPDCECGALRKAQRSTGPPKNGNHAIKAAVPGKGTQALRTSSDVREQKARRKSARDKKAVSLPQSIFYFEDGSDGSDDCVSPASLGEWVDGKLVPRTARPTDWE